MLSEYDFSIIMQTHDKERTSKSWKVDLSTNVILPFDLMSLVMPNMELGALAEMKFQGFSINGEKHSCLLQAHELLVWGRVSGIDTAFHNCR